MKPASFGPFLFLTLVLHLCTNTMLAGKLLVMKLSDGAVEKYALNQNPVISIESKFLCVKTSELETLYNLLDIESFCFEEENTNGITHLPPKNRLFFFNQNANKFICSFTDSTVSGTIIQLFDLAGHTVPHTINRSESEIEVDVSMCKPGIYIIKIGNQTIKLIKR